MAAKKYNPNRPLQDMLEHYVYSRSSSELHESAEEIFESELKLSRAEVVKSPSAARSKNIYRDAAFVREIQSLDSRACVTAGDDSSVCYPLSPLSPSHTALYPFYPSIETRKPRRAKAYPLSVNS